MIQTKKYLVAMAFALAIFMVNAPSAMATTSILGRERFAEQELSLVPEAKTSVEVKSFYQFPLLRSHFTALSTTFSAFHRGIDIRSPQGSPVRSILPGVVREVGFQAGGYGHFIVIEHENGLVSLYAHLSKVEVGVGDTITSLTKIGEIGSTGRSTGPHLHLEIHSGNKAINPLSILPEPVK